MNNYCSILAAVTWSADDRFVRTVIAFLTPNRKHVRVFTALPLESALTRRSFPILGSPLPPPPPAPSVAMVAASGHSEHRIGLDVD